ncbi:MAG: ABC transporter ATP-binding protein [Bacillota bacterium]
MIQFEAVSKQIGDRRILDRLTFGVGRGRVLGLLGPNGAGKTTAIRLLAGVWQPSAGRVRVGGIDMALRPHLGRRLLGVVPGEVSLYESLTVWENVRLFTGYYGAGPAAEERARALLSALEMDEAINQPAGRLSKGMRQKVAIARALAHAPEVLVLDEPTTGLDVASTDALERFIRAHHTTGGTILLCTHDLHQALRLADEVLVLSRGRVCWQGERSAIPSAEWLSELLIGASQEGRGRGDGLEPVAALEGGAPASAAADLP